VPEQKLPSRRERRRAKRRERRIARGRRLITYRTLLFVILLGGVLAGAWYAVRWYDTNSYFVGVDHNELVIYQGRIGGFLWYNPVEVQRTGATTADVPATYLDQLHAGVEESSVASAANYVRNLEATKSCETNPSSSFCSPSASSATTAPTTTAASGATTTTTAAAH
jgi:protein phosphatase